MALPSFTYSGVSYSGKPAGTTAFALTTSGGKSIPYLQRAHIHVASTTDGGATMTPLARPTAWDFDSAGTSVVLKTGIAAGTSIVLQRITPDDGLFVTFGQGTLLTAEEINEAELFDLYLIQELHDQLRNGLAIPSASAAYWNRSPRRLDVNMGAPGEVAQTIDRLDQLLGNWPAITADRFVPTADAVAARLDPYVQPGLPAPLLLPQREQLGKQWFDQEDLAARYWDAGLGAWITLATQGPPGQQGVPGPKGDSADSVDALVTGWMGDRNELRNAGFVKYSRPWPNAKGIVVEGWVQRNNDTTATYTPQTGSLSAMVLLGGHGTRLDIEMAPGTLPGRYLYLQQLVQNQFLYYGEHLSFSFHIKSTVATKIAVEIFSSPVTEGSGSDVTLVGRTVRNVTTAWQKISLSGLIPDPKLTTPQNRYVGVRIWFDAGADYAATMPGVGGVAATLSITDAQLERGKQPTRCLVRHKIVESMLASATHVGMWLRAQWPNAPAGGVAEANATILDCGSLGFVVSGVVPVITPGQQNNGNVRVNSYKTTGRQIIAIGEVTIAGAARIEQYVDVDYTSTSGLVG